MTVCDHTFKWWRHQVNHNTIHTITVQLHIYRIYLNLGHLCRVLRRRPCFNI